MRRSPQSDFTLAQNTLPERVPVYGTSGACQEQERSKSPVCLYWRPRNSLSLTLACYKARGAPSWRGIQNTSADAPNAPACRWQACSSAEEGRRRNPAAQLAPPFPIPAQGRRGRGLAPNGRTHPAPWPRPSRVVGPRRLAGARGRSSGRWAEGDGPGSGQKPGREKDLPGWPDSGFLLRPGEKPEQLGSSRDCQSGH